MTSKYSLKKNHLAIQMMCTVNLKLSRYYFTFGKAPLSKSSSHGVVTNRDLVENSVKTVTEPSGVPPSNTEVKPLTINECRKPCPKLPSFDDIADHVLFFKATDINQPTSDECADMWDQVHVRMPHSPKSLYLQQPGVFASRWSHVVSMLRRSFSDVDEFKTAVVSYNDRFASVWNFSGLKEVVSREPALIHTVTSIANLACQLPLLLTKPIPLMRCGQVHSFTFSQRQLATLLANAFCCTFPRRNKRGPDAEYANFPSINFSSLLSVFPRDSERAKRLKREKTRCILSYFERVLSAGPETAGSVTFTRRVLHCPPCWVDSPKLVSSIKLVSVTSGTIEHAGPDTIQVDFANRFLGGGVLNSGCVQEEILLAIKPEILAGRLFVEALEDNEALIVEGARQYADYSGYAESFVYKEAYHEDTTALDEWHRAPTCVTVIDALMFDDLSSQLSEGCLLRELNKAYCGFSDDLAPYRPLPSIVATGNWGCGAFGGDKEVKAIIQLMACVECGKQMNYFTFWDKQLHEGLVAIYQKLCEKSCSNADLWRLLRRFDDHVRAQGECSLFEFMLHELSE